MNFVTDQEINWSSTDLFPASVENKGMHFKRIISNIKAHLSKITGSVFFIKDLIRNFLYVRG